MKFGHKKALWAKNPSGGALDPRRDLKSKKGSKRKINIS